MIMMYISVLPIAISVRRTNVYEEKSLGIWASAADEQEDEGEPSYVGAHLRRQLSFDLWYIFLGLFVISISEGHRLQSGDPNFSMFAVLFEVVSAYGTVGLSLGYPTINASFSAEFGVIAKLVIIAMQVRGRHRGLPYELDRAILLPSESLHAQENRDPVQIRRRGSGGTTVTYNDRTGGNSAMGDGGGTLRRNRNRSQDRGAQNFLGSLLHPGPTIPNSHRNSQRPDIDYERERRQSRATISETRSVSPRGVDGNRDGLTLVTTFDGSNAAATESDTMRPSSGRSAWTALSERPKASGRRDFFKEGLNEEESHSAA
jgi:hypothetical protein